MASVSHSLPSLEITAAPDDMEITSELGIFDNSTDIDLDLTGEYQGDPDGDFMLEDVSEIGQAPSVQDQEMNQEEITYGEEDVTFDDAVAEDGGIVFDEELTDVNIDGPSGGDIGHMNENAKSQEQSSYTLGTSAEGFEAAEEGHTHLQHEAPHVSPEHTVEHEAHQSKAVVDGSEGVQVHDFPTTEHVGGSPDYVDEFGEISGPHQAVEYAAEHTVEDSQNTTHSASPHLETRPDAQDATDVTQFDSGYAAPAGHTNNDEVVPSAPGASEAGQDHLQQDALGEFEEEHTSDDRFHSTIAVYEGEEIYLFQSREQEQQDACLVQDASLVSRSIYDLLQACRGALAEPIPEEEELQLEVHDLDLIIGEESAHALSTSFSEILDVYISLCSLDGVDHPQPLYVTLSTKKKFSARLGFLRAAIADGRGMSHLWYGQADEEYSDEQADLTGEEQGTAEVTEQPLDGGASSLAELGDNEHSTDVQDVPAEDSTKVAAAEESAGVSINAKSHADDHVFHESEAGKSREAYDVLATEETEQKDNSTDNSTVLIIQQLAEENPSKETYGDSDRHAKTDDHAAPGDDGLIDYGEQDEHNSTGSSTIVGDGSNVQDDANAQAASETAPDVASTAEGQGAWNMQDHEQGLAHEELEFHYEGTDQDGDQEGKQDGNQDEYQDENQEQFALGGDFSAQLGENEFNYDLWEGEDGGHPEGQTYEGGEEHFDDGTRFNADEIDWEDPVAPDSNPDQHTPVEMPHEHNAEQEETWDDFLDTDQPQDQDETQPTGEDTSEPTLNVQPQIAASAETSVVGGNNVEPLGQADEVAFDDFDEITYGEEDEDATRLQAQSEQPNESPPGKRSLTEHLEGGHNDDSETAAKRLRSI